MICPAANFFGVIIPYLFLSRNRKKKNQISASNHREKVMEKLSQTTAKKREMKTDLKKLLEEKQKGIFAHCVFNLNL